ncbi:putative multi-drug efflux transporter [Kitasatospora herbaricolor]|uniref:MFS transporter n=1 Tax=Kitasatospora herbaricolor TaxID=68217 RepID=UPI001749E869|nr:MFS transporter [Kitasatospora herbaricolor]MDQ0311122.1 MFS family permease [Kitasatospora herbaricolor]GGV11872.1 putative multi-drug efflux transporter [Kitasatospora herbaricolor]
MADLSPAGSGLPSAPFPGRHGSGRLLSEALLPLELAPRTQLQLAAVSRWNAVRGIRVGLCAAALLLLLIGANLATPIYPYLQSRLGLTALDTTVLFTVYVFALVPVLAAVGHWSDLLGRRALILPAVALAAGGDAIFATAGSFWQLAAGRAVQGIAVGMSTGAAGAALGDLLPDRPTLAAKLTLACSAGGVALGPIVGATLSGGANPLLTPFLVHALALLALCVPLALVHPRMPGRRRPPASPPRVTTPAHLRPRRLALPASGRREFLLAAGAGFVSYAVFGVYLSLAPAFSAKLLHSGSHLTGAVVAALLLGSSAAVQLLVPPTSDRLVIALGMTGLAAGLALVVAAQYTGTPALLFIGSVLGGACQGVAFRSLFTSAVAAMDPERRGGELSTLWVIVYLGSSLPIVAVGALTQRYGLLPAVSGFGVVAALACMTLAVGVLRPGRR